MKLELYSGGVYQNPTTDQLTEALELLEPKSNKSLILHKSPTTALHIVNEQPRRYYIYEDYSGKQKQATQPVSLSMANRILIAYATDTRKWQSGIRFEESFAGNETSKKLILQEMSIGQLELRKKRIERTGLIPMSLMALIIILVWVLWLVKWKEYFELDQTIQLVVFSIMILFGLITVGSIRRKYKAELEKRK